MGRPKSQIAYPRNEILAVLRTLNELVVSLDHVASASFDMTETENNAALADFIWRHKIMQKAAQARRILSAPFPTDLGPDEMGVLEREMQNIRYWKAKKKK